MTKSWYHVENAADIDSPALLVYPDRIRQNIERMIGYAGGLDRIRPHVKTHKMPEVIDLQIALGVERFKCSTLAEAEMAAGCGAADVFLAHQLVGPKITRLVELAKAYPATRFKALADDESTINEIGTAFSAAELTVDVFLDIDNGFGRSGIEPGEAAVARYKQLSNTPGIRAAGLHVYDGHLRNRDVTERISHSDDGYTRVTEFISQLESTGAEIPEIVAGGSPTFPAHARREGVQCSPGTCLLWDANYATNIPDLEFLHAAVLLTRVVSKPRGNRLTLDLGYKSVSPDNPDPRVVLFGLEDARAVVHNEEHLTIETESAENYSVGDVLYGIPWHVCPTVALHESAVVVRHGRGEDRWRIVARNRKINY
ncbi:MAG: D-TA family PLP-dependent enzyme [Pirellulales bacterium]|nr:D-TA family PLP-dependent enzyme [Pirellulales bacterium]